MGRKCVVPLCKTGYATKAEEKPEKRISLFSCPSEDLLPEWTRRISRENYTVTLQSPVCARHFYPEDIITHDITILANGQIHRHERGVPKLAATAVPKIFDGPKYRTVPPTRKRTSRDRSQASEAGGSKKARKEVAVPQSPDENGTQAISPHPPIPAINIPPPSPDNKVIQDMEDAVLLFDFHQEVLSQYKEQNADVFGVQELHKKAATVKLPKMWGVHTDGESTIFAQIDKNFDVIRCVKFTDSLTPQVYFKKKLVEARPVKNLKEVADLIQRTHVIRLCVGYGDENFKKGVPNCTGHVPFGAPLSKVRCLYCENYRKRLQKTKKRANTLKKKSRKKAQNKNQKIRRLKKKVMTLTEELNEKKAQMKKMSETTIAALLETITPEHREIVQACINAAKHPRKGRRYTTKWVYECLRMRMKAPGLYNKLQRENTLPVPSETTLKRCLRRLRPIYGIDENVLAALKKKLETLPEAARHGVLLLDEMALQEWLSFDTESLKVHGLVDLGKFTDDQEKNKRGDHGLVAMVQPFRGDWVQAIAAFLGSGAVKGEVLHQIVIELIILLERAGFMVDAVVTDGAAWNRAMWECFEIGKGRHSCEHPVDPGRQLRMISDFPHLIKNLWARLCNKKYLVLPEGTVKLEHWKAVVDKDAAAGVKRAYNLTSEMLSPTNFQKMNVGMAMRFFSNTVAAAMESYKKEGIAELQDSDPTIKFIKRIHAVIEAMNSQVPVEALRADPLSRHNKVLRDFLEYLDQMEDLAQTRVKVEMKEKAEGLQKAKLAKQKAQGNILQSTTTSKKAIKTVPVAVGHAIEPKGGAMHEFTTSTFIGLYVTVESTLSLIEYLSQDLNYNYLMTRRLNQDALEHFFGNIRTSCGSGSHPDPKMFIQLFRLLSTYSLIKPPRGSNVSGCELLQSILELKDLVGENITQRRKDIEAKIDVILDGGIPDEFHGALEDHSYLDRRIDAQALTVLAGYVSRKMRSLNLTKSCPVCFSAVCAPDDEPTHERETFLNLKSYGGLLRPSEEMFAIVFQLEGIINKVTSNTPLESNLFVQIVDTLLQHSDISLMGCEEHNRSLTSSIIMFYLTCRMHFVCRESNQVTAQKKRAKKDLAKKSKM